jgi:hypothetical protein
VKCERNGTLLLLARLSDIGRETARGRFLVGEPVAMRRPAQVPLDRMRFPLTLAGALRTVWADVVSTPLPGHLAALVRRLSVDRERRTLRGGALSGEEQRWGKHNGNVEPY